MSLPTTQRAIKTNEYGKASVHTDVDIPTLPPNGWVLVKTSYVGLNPTDWKHISGEFSGDQKPGFTVGCDFAGTIVKLGPSITKPLKIGQRIAGFTHGVKSNNPESGSFAEYIIAKGDVCVALPDNVSDAEAGCYGVGLVTVGQGLYQSLELPWPSKPLQPAGSQWLLIYGGSTGMGLFAIQFTKLSGMSVVATCSSRNFELLKGLGADACFDYKDPDCAHKIRDLTQDKMIHAFDTISSAASASICASALSSAPHVKYSALLPEGPDAFPRKDAALNTYTWGYTHLGEPFDALGTHCPASPENYGFAKRWMTECESLIAEKKFKIAPDVRDGGLDAVFEGLDDLRLGKVSGGKIVYKIA